jgi:CubicO group peptidase (beta-lactamase class C family)
VVVFLIAGVALTTHTVWSAPSAQRDVPIAASAETLVQGGRVVLRKGYGFASFTPPRRVDPNVTLFRIGSITKTFTWIAVMKGVESGKIDLDAPVNNYLPPELQIPAEGFARPIRVRDLMTHSPGFEDHVFGVLFADTPDRVRPLEAFLRQERPRRVREPGALSSYSNYGAALAGEIVARVEGRPWQDAIEREVLTPLGLSHTSVREPYPPRPDLPEPMPATLARDLSSGFRWDGLTYRARSIEFITPVAPAGVMSSTAVDMSRYMLMLLGDGTLDGITIFGSRAAAAFRTPMTSAPRELGAIDAGFFEFPLPGGFRSYGHNGGTLSFFTNMTLVPELRLGIFVATNTEGGGQISDPLPSRIVERFYSSPPAPPSPMPAGFAERARAFTGSYLSTRRAYRGLEGVLMRLQAVWTIALSPDGHLVLRLGNEPRLLEAMGPPDAFRVADLPGGLYFVRSGTRADTIVLGPVAFERISALYQPSTLNALAILTLLSSAAIVMGFFLRIGRRLPATDRQRAAGHVQLAVALLWVVCAAAFAAWGVRASDVTNIIYRWPGPLIRTASSAALLASALTVVMVALLPAIWRGSALPEAGWSFWRRLRFSVATVVFAAFGALLALWGALQPWLPA